jgi:hypothetical protein
LRRFIAGELDDHQQQGRIIVTLRCALLAQIKGLADDLA